MTCIFLIIFAVQKFKPTILEPINISVWIYTSSYLIVSVFAISLLTKYCWSVSAGQSEDISTDRMGGYLYFLFLFSFLSFFLRPDSLTIHFHAHFTWFIRFFLSSTQPTNSKCRIKSTMNAALWRKYPVHQV